MSSAQLITLLVLLGLGCVWLGAVMGKRAAGRRQSAVEPVLIPAMESDPERREELMAAIQAQGLPGDDGVADRPHPVVSLEAFFTGNRDLGSIGPNLAADEHPGVDGFYAALREIRTREDVQDVLVGICDSGDGDWPFSHHIYVLTGAPREEVARWLAPLHPDEVFEGYFLDRRPTAVPAPASGAKVFCAWWD